MVLIGLLPGSYEVVSAGLEVTPGPDSGALSILTGGAGTNAIGPAGSIEPIGSSGNPANESIVFQVYRSDGINLGAPEGATDVMLMVNGAGSTSFTLTAEDKDGLPLGSAPTTVSASPVDVSALIPGEIHKLTVEATGGAVIVTGIAYTHVCLGSTPVR